MATTTNIVYAKDTNGNFQSLTSNASGHLLTYDSNSDALLTTTNLELTKIVDFAGQGQNDISDDGVISKLQVFSYGRDRAGDKMRAIDIDSTGKLNVNVVETMGAGDLTARTNITDTASTKNLKCDSNGNLQVGIAENPTVHLRGNDGDNGSGSNRLVKCSAKGELITKPDMDIYSGAVNNTTALGDGSTQLRTVNLMYDNVNGKARSQKCDGSGIPYSRLVANSNHTATGTDAYITCDALGRMYINSDIGIPINALLNDGSSTVKSLRADSTGKLDVNAIPNLSRGAIGGFTAGTGSQWSANGFSTKIDMAYHKTIEFHIQGSMSAGHNIYACVSNDDSTYVRHEALSTQSVGGSDVFKGTFTSGFRYVKFENAGADISTTTYKQYSLYN